MTATETTYTNTQISANTINLTSGTDTNLAGAVLTGDTVNAAIGGNLTITSRQDTATFAEKQSSTGGNLSVSVTGGTSSASVSASKTKLNSNYQSVTEQSGIRAGDGGFNVSVAGKTNLTGGVQELVLLRS